MNRYIIHRYFSLLFTGKQFGGALALNPSLNLQLKRQTWTLWIVCTAVACVAAQQFICMMYIYVGTLPMCNIMMNRVKDGSKSWREIQNDCLNCEMEKKFLWNPTKWFYRCWSRSNIASNHSVGRIDMDKREEGETTWIFMHLDFYFIYEFNFRNIWKMHFRWFRNVERKMILPWIFLFSVENQFLFQCLWCFWWHDVCSSLDSDWNKSAIYLAVFWAGNDKNFASK